MNTMFENMGVVRLTPTQYDELIKTVLKSASERDVAIAERDELLAKINTPHTDDFFEAVRLEAAHQQMRWGVDGDAGKAPQDWFWLIGYLAGKSIAAFVRGDKEKGLHHIISTAAVLLNWHRHSTGEMTAMRPGIEPPADGGGSNANASVLHHSV